MHFDLCDIWCIVVSWSLKMASNGQENAIFITAMTKGHKQAVQWCLWLYLEESEEVLSNCLWGGLADIWHQQRLIVQLLVCNFFACSLTLSIHISASTKSHINYCTLFERKFWARSIEFNESTTFLNINTFLGRSKKGDQNCHFFLKK